MYADFEVIDIANDTTLYPTLLGIKQAIDNKVIINFKKIMLSFEYSKLRVVAPIDLLEVQRYTEPINNEGKGDYINHIYNVISMRDDYVNPTTDENLRWQSISFCTSRFGKVLKKWKNQMHQVSMRKCTRITWSIRQVGTQASELPIYEVLPNLVSFLIEFEEKVTKHQFFSSLVFVLKDTPS